MISAHIRRMFNSVIAVTVAVGGAGAQLDEPFPPFFDLYDEWDSDESPYVRFLPHFGERVQAVGVGDVNHDGYDDILIGGQYSSMGCMLVFGSEGPHPSDSVDLPVDGIHATEIDLVTRGEFWVSGIGDINSDGIPDISVTGVAIGTPSTKEVFVIFGRDSQAGQFFPAVLSVDDMDASEGFVIELPHEAYKATSAGDLNNDGIDDVAFGVYHENGWPNGYVLYGRNTAVDGSFPASITDEYFDGTNGFVIATTYGGTSSTAAAGDVNNDGIDDLVIGSIRFRGVDASRPNGGGFVIFGRDADTDGAFPASIENSYFDGERGFSMIGEDLGRSLSWIGYSVSGGGDLNNDGVDDIALGSTLERTYVVFGRDSKSNDTFEPQLDLAELDGQTGFVINTDALSMDFVGDVNSDGIEDLAVGAPFGRYLQWSYGSAYVIYGRDSGQGFHFPAWMDLHGVSDPFGSDYLEVRGTSFCPFGWSVSAAGDMNGDGVADYLATDDDCRYTVLVYGREAATPCPSDANGDGFLTPADFSAWVSAFHSQSPACDQNGDGACSPADFSAWVGNYNAGC